MAYTGTKKRAENSPLTTGVYYLPSVPLKMFQNKSNV